MDSDKAFEEEVRRALRRAEAPEHFAERLQARLAAGPGESATAWARWFAAARFWRFAAVTAVLLMLPAAGVRVEQHLQQRRTQAAEAQFDRALQVTGHALDHVTAQLSGGQVGAISQALNTVSGEKR